MLDLKQMQTKHSVWTYDNFSEVVLGPKYPELMILGIMEELGELCHAHGKRESKTRVNEDHTENIKDAIGDIFIFLMSYATSQGLDLEDIIVNTWNEVRQRDWRRYPENGKEVNQDSARLTIGKRE